MSIRLTSFAALMTVAAIAACDPEDGAPLADGDDDASAEQIGVFGGPDPAFVAAGYECPIWMCGFNAAEVNGTSVRELNLDGEPNADGMQILTVVPAAGALLQGYSELDVEGDALVLRHPITGEALGGSAVVGTIVVVKGPGLLGVLETTAIVIAGHEKVKAWAAGAPAVDAYSFLYVTLDGLGQQNVCVGDLVDHLARAATVLGGETYDLDGKIVHSGKDRWLTIACAGSATAKLKLLGYGPQSGETTPEQRQATLKMITADYCGDGVSYTQNGTPVMWENLEGTVHVAGDASGIEAVWTAEGALCLDGKRSPVGKVACSLPSCDDYDLGDGEWISYLPVYSILLD